MSKNNERNPQTTQIALGSSAADATTPAIYFPKKSKILSVHIINGAALAASDTNFFAGSLKNGSTEIAEIDTRAAHENGLVANTAKALNIVADQEIVAKGTTLKFEYNETDAGSNVALSNAILAITFAPL